MQFIKANDNAIKTNIRDSDRQRQSHSKIGVAPSAPEYQTTGENTMSNKYDGIVNVFVYTMLIALIVTMGSCTVKHFAEAYNEVREAVTGQ